MVLTNITLKWFLISSFIFPRAINAEALVGTVGGYLGLFLGYSILQLPEKINDLAKKVKSWYIEFMSPGKQLENKQMRKWKFV